MSNQVAFITGSSRGIGFGIAKELARRSFSVAVHGRSKSQELADAKRAIEELGVKSCAVYGDLSDLGNYNSLLDQVESQLGLLTTLVSNAGVGAIRRADVMETQEDSFDHCFNLNVKAPYFLIQAFANRLLSRERDENLHHSVISISSVSAVAASTNRGEYCASKAAAAMTAKVFAARLAPENIQVFDIQPGVIETDMSRPALPAYQKRIDEEGLTLISRIGQPEDVAKSCAAAASGDLPYSVGQVLRMDGGIVFERL